MPTSNTKASSPGRWTDSQTGIPGSTANSVRYDHYYVGQKLSSSDYTGRPLTFSGVRGGGQLKRGCSPALGMGYYIPTMVDGSSTYHNPLWSGTRPYNMTLAKNQAWDKLIGKLKSDESSLGAAAAEGRETFNMVATRVTGLYRAYKALRKGDFRRFLRELSVDPKRKHRSLIRSSANEASGLWLEYWFGWSPTVQDIGSAALALSYNPVLATVRERATHRFVLPQASRQVGSSRPRRIITQSGEGLVRHGATFELSNENLFLANRLGLINPVSVAWEVVPFSFVVDWFTGFGGYLQSFTDLAGLAVRDPWNLEFTRLKQRGEYWDNNSPGNRCIVDWSYVIMKRGTSLFAPVPVTPRLVNFGDSLTRAASAVSLLTTIFLDGKQPRGR